MAGAIYRYEQAHVRPQELLGTYTSAGPALHHESAACPSVAQGKSVHKRPASTLSNRTDWPPRLLLQGVGWHQHHAAPYVSHLDPAAVVYRPMT